MTTKHRMLLAGVISSGLLAASLRPQTTTASPAPQDATPPIVPADDARITPDPSKNANKPSAGKPAKGQSTSAAEPEAAVATQRNVNVRGQAKLNSEIVTHLKRGDLVTILEEVTLKNAKADEPAKWAKILLPAGTAVWVSAHFVDQNSKTVTATRLRLRSGPGENYSTLGMIEKGTVVKELETRGNWIKIEAPAGAYAFVAAHLLSKNPADVGPALARANPVPAPTPAPTTPPPAPIPTTPTPPPTVVEQPPPVVTPTDAPPPAPTTPPAVVIEPAAITAAAAPAPSPDEPLPKRIVTREGMVRGSASIQAPTYYVLRSLDNNKTINYLHSPTTNIFLKEYQYQRVLVTGEELLDERWPRTPVIDIETIQTVP